MHGMFDVRKRRGNVSEMALQKLELKIPTKTKFYQIVVDKLKQLVG